MRQLDNTAGLCEVISKNTLKIRLEGAIAQSIRPSLTRIPVIELISSTKTGWIHGSAAADVVVIDTPIWLATTEEDRQTLRTESGPVVILATAPDDEETALAQLKIDADDYLLPPVDAAILARAIRHARQRRALVETLKSTQAKLAETHSRLTALLDEGSTYRVGAELARESELVRETKTRYTTHSPKKHKLMER
jgi:DNA-binding response OmpR family regulator